MLLLSCMDTAVNAAKPASLCGLFKWPRSHVRAVEWLVAPLLHKKKTKQDIIIPPDLKKMFSLVFAACCKNFSLRRWEDDSELMTASCCVFHHTSSLPIFSLALGWNCCITAYFRRNGRREGWGWGEVGALADQSRSEVLHNRGSFARCHLRPSRSRRLELLLFFNNLIGDFFPPSGRLSLCLCAHCITWHPRAVYLKGEDV